MTKLKIDQVSRTFPARHGHAPTKALEPTNLEVGDNDFVTILGPSGCGKSTLLRIVAGLDRPTSGRVVLDGREVTGAGADRGMVFQSYTLFPWLTVRENIAFGLRERGILQAERHKIANCSGSGNATRRRCCSSRTTLRRRSFSAAASSS
jgi:NitT/TauT family transport system ATP-binding protein